MTCLHSLSNRLPHSFSLSSSPFPMRLVSFSSISFISLIVMKLVSHHDETSVSSWWNQCLFTMKLTLCACVNDAQHVRKEWGIGEKECWNRWKTIRKQVRKIGWTCQLSMKIVLTALIFRHKRVVPQVYCQKSNRLLGQNIGSWWSYVLSDVASVRG